MAKKPPRGYGIKDWVVSGKQYGAPPAQLDHLMSQVNLRDKKGATPYGTSNSMYYLGNGQAYDKSSGKYYRAIGFDASPGGGFFSGGNIFKTLTKLAATAVGFAYGGPPGAAAASAAVGYTQGSRGLDLALDAVGGYMGGKFAYNIGSGVVNSASLAAGGAGQVGSGATLGSIGSGLVDSVRAGGGLSNILGNASNALSGSGAFAPGGAATAAGGVRSALSGAANVAGAAGAAAPAAASGFNLSGMLSNPSTLLNAYSAIQGSQVAKDQAKAMQRANSDSLALQSRMYDQTRADLDPFRTAGTAANQALSNYLGLSGTPGAAGYGDFMKRFTPADLQNDPGYQFRLAQGNKNLNQSMGAQGNLFSGQALKAAQEFGQGLADQTFNEAYTRYVQDQNNAYAKLAGQSAQGQSAAGLQGSAGQSYATSATNLLGNRGDIAANKYGAQNQAINQGLAGIVNGTYGFTGGGQSSYSGGAQPASGWKVDAYGNKYYA